MSTKTVKKQSWTLAPHKLADSFVDFLLSRRVMQCTKGTMDFYHDTAGKFLMYLEQQGITSPDEVTARHVRAYLAELTERGLKDKTVHAHARAIRTLCRFWYSEGYTPQAVIKFDMPKMEKRRLPVLTASQVKDVIEVCNVRDKAIILFMVDTGLRRAVYK